MGRAIASGSTANQATSAVNPIAFEDRCAFVKSGSCSEICEIEFEGSIGGIHFDFPFHDLFMEIRVNL